MKMPSSTPPLLFSYPPQCCEKERERYRTSGLARFEEDYHAGWDSRSLWKRLVSVLRSVPAPYRKSFAMGYAQGVLAHQSTPWGMDEFVRAAVEAASTPPV